MTQLALRASAIWGTPTRRTSSSGRYAVCSTDGELESLLYEDSLATLRPRLSAHGIPVANECARDPRGISWRQARQQQECKHVLD